MWPQPRIGEYRYVIGGRILRIYQGHERWFCYNDGDYLGTETHLDAAKKRCLYNRKGSYVMVLETTEEAFRRLKKPPKLTWTQVDKDNWEATVEGETLPTRIRALDRKTFAVYRDAVYLGSEATLDEAQKRAVINEVSERNRVMTLWEQEHGGELPPVLQMTDAERAEWWRRHPPKAAPARPALGRTKAAAGPGVAEDPATARLRAALAVEGGAGRGGKAKAARRSPEVPQGREGTIRVKPGAGVPKKPGSSAHVRWTLLWSYDGKPVAEFIAAKGNPTTLENAIDKGLVTVEKEVEA